MAALIVTAQGNRGQVHRLGSSIVHAKLASWTHDINVWLDSDGGYKIEISKIHGKALKVIEGKISDLETKED